jgi:hypothetical protein
MDDMQWTTDDGQWRMDNGQRTTNNGWRTSDDGQRTMDDGWWTRDNGQQTMNNGQWTMELLAFFSPLWDQWWWAVLATGFFLLATPLGSSTLPGMMSWIFLFFSGMFKDPSCITDTIEAFVQ